MPTPPFAAGVLRAEAWAGEARVNLVRVVALIGFYGHFLYQVGIQRAEAPPPPQYVEAVTALVVAWGCLIVGVHVALGRRWLPGWLPYVAALGDVLLITGLLILGEGVRSPLIVLYFLAIASAPLRLSLPVVYATTLASLAGYLIVLGRYVFVQIGATEYYANAALRVPRTQQVTTLLGLVVAGLFAGQIVRQSRRLAAGPSTSSASEG